MVLIIQKSLAVLMAALMIFYSFPGRAGDNIPDVSADYAVMMNDRGQVIYSRKADIPTRIASTTKLMTALLVLENVELDENVLIEPSFCNIEGSSMYLRPGELLTVRELLAGLLLPSGNDAAVALAEYTAGSVEAFVAMMNERAAELGMESTSFENPHGLDGENHYSTAADMARLMCCCMERQDFVELCGMTGCRIGDRAFTNHNKLLWQYDGCIAGKTGYTKAAGRCLVSCCQRGRTRLICVTLSAPDDWNDHIKLYDWAFANYCTKNVMEDLSFQVSVSGGSPEAITAVPAADMELFLPKETEVKLVAELPEIVFAPVNSGETAGQIWVIIDDEIIGSCELIYSESAYAHDSGA